MAERATVLHLLANPSAASALTLEERQMLVAELAALQIAILAAPTPAAAPSSEPHKDYVTARLLTMAEAAERSRKSVRWLRDHWRKELPFGRRIGRSVLFPEAEFTRWLKRP